MELNAAVDIVRRGFMDNLGRQGIKIPLEARQLTFELH
jgi:hypothetical protein